jgi:hypothetical protein
MGVVAVMIPGNLFLATLLFLSGVGICINSWYLGLGTFAKPSAGFLPFGLGVLLTFCSLPLCSRYFLSLKRNELSSNEKVWSSVNFKKVFLILLSLILYMLLLVKLGFLPTAFCVQLMLFKVVGTQKWIPALLQTIATIAVVYLIFIILLDVYIPLFPDWMY